MSGHTPGPWTYFVGNANGRGLIRIETAHDAKPVAGVHIASMARGGVSEANARLIAAAPKALVLARYAVDNPDFDSAVFDHMAREFIAEATGEQP